MRYVEILKQIAAGGVDKVIFAGYTTDPLNYNGIDDLLQVAHSSGQIFGFHTKGLRFSERFLGLLTSPSTRSKSYFSVSVDAGTNDSYNKVHGVRQSKAKLYDRVLQNLSQVANMKTKRNSRLDLSATYLINGHNNSIAEIEKVIKDMRNTGVDLLRFTFPQVPRGYSKINSKNILRQEDVRRSYAELQPLVESADCQDFRCFIMDCDAEIGQTSSLRTLPCFARFIFPSVGFDGWLSHCSESAAPHFRNLALGNLAQRDFWDVFYDYDTEHIYEMLDKTAKKMYELDCRCDRKEHVVNLKLQYLGAKIEID